MAEDLRINLVIRTRGLPDYARYTRFTLVFFVRVSIFHCPHRGLCDEFGLALIEYASKDEATDLASEANILIWTGE